LEFKNILQSLYLGNSVAEFDEALEKYFVETTTFRAIIEEKGDIIAGDKGTGKTALFKILLQRYRSRPELKNVEVVPGFNVSGNPVFQRLTEGKPLSEGEYIQ
jgi:Cdc6-like AAA superfamily ATPase